MSKTGKRIVNLFFILVILAFFLTPLGYESKVLLNRIFASGPEITAVEKRQPIRDYNWILKDENWDFFNFERSKGRVILVVFWASWRIPSVASLNGIQRLYDDYGGKVDFYIITDEEKAPVEALMQKRGYTFPVTYRIVGEQTPFHPEKILSGYIIDQQGRIAAQQAGATRWNSAGVRKLLDSLLAID